jgi:hypothetical protein
MACADFIYSGLFIVILSTSYSSIYSFGEVGFLVQEKTFPVFIALLYFFKASSKYYSGVFEALAIIPVPLSLNYLKASALLYVFVKSSRDISIGFGL